LESINGSYCLLVPYIEDLLGNLVSKSPTGAQCSMFTGDYSGSINQLKIAQHNLELCGMSGGALDNVISGCQAEIHLQKPEYAEARHIYRRVLVTALAELNPAPCAFALLNIAKVDSIIGGSQEEVLKNLEKAKAVFTNLQYPFGMTACDMILAKLKLREGKFTSANTLTESLNSCWGKATQSTLYCLDLRISPNGLPPISILDLNGRRYSWCTHTNHKSSWHFTKPCSS
jgi:tetratricopeptide (TPR) repeat protein